jgi:glycopeptide antibiotics resistance protein
MKQYSKKVGLYILIFIYVFLILFWFISKGTIAYTNGILPYPLKVSQSMNWVPFYLSSYMPIDILIRNIVFKLLLLMPLSYILPRIFPKTKVFKNYVFYIIGTAFLVEFIQVYLLIGYFDITDIIYYSVGSIASYIALMKISKTTKNES